MWPWVILSISNQQPFLHTSYALQVDLPLVHGRHILGLRENLPPDTRELGQRVRLRKGRRALCQVRSLILLAICLLQYLRKFPILSLNLLRYYGALCCLKCLDFGLPSKAASSSISLTNFTVEYFPLVENLVEIMSQGP